MALGTLFILCPAASSDKIMKALFTIASEAPPAFPLTHQLTTVQADLNGLSILFMIHLLAKVKKYHDKLQTRRRKSSPSAQQAHQIVLGPSKLPLSKAQRQCMFFFSFHLEAYLKPFLHVFLFSILRNLVLVRDLRCFEPRPSTVRRQWIVKTSRWMGGI